MTDKDIIKALEYCSKSSWLSDCDGCPCYDEKEDIQTSECQERLMKNVLNLINRLQSEIERLNALIAETNKQRGKVIHAITRIDEVKTEAYKEFVEKVTSTICKNTYPDFDKDGKAVIVWNVDGYKAIENLANELTERKECKID